MPQNLLISVIIGLRVALRPVIAGMTGNLIDDPLV